MIFLFYSSLAHAAEKVVRSESFGLGWDSPWSLTRIVLFFVLAAICYFLIRNTLFPYLLNPDKENITLMPRGAFKITLGAIMFLWIILFLMLFSLFPGQELRVSSNIIPGAKTFVVIQYIDMRWFYVFLCLIFVLLIFSVLMPSGKRHQRN